MIHVPRPTDAIPGPWRKRAEDETGDAYEHHGLPRPTAAPAPDQRRRRRRAPSTTFDFRAYSDDALKEALNRIYANKCAYCECEAASNQPMDVEHFRPKNAVVELEDPKVKHGGYWWLGAEADNLFPSCADCNRLRWHQIAADAEQEKRGKECYFPLARPDLRAQQPGDEKLEEPLLLNPSDPGDLPDAHLEFLVDDEKRGVVRPRSTQAGPSPKGEKSILVFGLDRLALVQSRSGHASRVVMALKPIERSGRRRASWNADDRSIFEEDLLEFDGAFLGPTAPFLAMTRAIVVARLNPLAGIAAVDELLRRPGFDL